jgi:dihydroorotase
MSYRLSGRAVFRDGTRNVSIQVDSGTIIAVEPLAQEPDSWPIIFPGFIDSHVHAREYARPRGEDVGAVQKWQAALEKETFSTAGRAAINGGVTLYAAMPNDARPPDDSQTYDAKMEISHSSPCPTVLFACVTRDSEPWADLPYKVYLDSDPSPYAFTSWQALETTLARYSGCRVFFHAEDPDVLRASQGSGPRWKVRPAEAELRAVERLLDWTAKLGLRSHVCHVSTEGAVRLIREFNDHSSIPVTCEAAPHHLFFSMNGGEVTSASGQRPAMPQLLDCNPPLRSEQDRRFLVEALRDGSVPILASDHAPHTQEDKDRGAPGMPHLDTLGAFAGWLLNRCAFTPTRIAQALSEAPGKLLAPDLDKPQGMIEPGAWASFTILDPTGSTLVEGASIRGRGPLQTRCKWSPFSGIELPGSVTATIIRGEKCLFES